MTTTTARPARATPRPLFVQRPAHPEQARVLRHAVLGYLQATGWTGDQVDATTLAVGEAINNAVCYGQDVPGGEVSLCCQFSPQDVLTVEVRNPGGDFRPDLDRACALPDDLAVHGRGFALMSMLMDDIHVFAEDGETVVRLVKRFAV